MTKRVKNNQDKDASSRGTNPKREKKASRKRKAELDRLQVEHQELLDRVAKARAKLDKRTQKLAVLEARMAELEKQNYLPEAEPLGQADAGKHGARPARLILDPRAAPDLANSQHIAGLIRTLRGHGIAAETGVASGESVEQLVRQAAEQGQGLVIVAGDDQSIESAAQQLCGTQTTLGVIPLGSENRLIRALGIPLHTGPAAALIGMGVTRTLDLMEVTGLSDGCQYFLQSAGVGLALPGAAGTAANQALPGVRDLGLRDARVLIEDAGREQIEANNQIVIFSNAPLLGLDRPGGPDWKIDDGLMNVHAFGSMDAAKVTDWINKPAGQSGEPISAVQSYVARRVQISGLGEDGERKIEIRIVPGALSAIVGNGPALALPVQSVPDDVETKDDQATKQGLLSLPILSFFGK